MERGESTSRIGKYQFVAALGQGGMAEVFLAVAQGPAGFSKLQVVKLLKKNLAIDADFLTMFLDEARLAARLNHPNIVQTNEVGEDRGRHYIVMEFLEGQTLQALRNRTKDKGGVPLHIHLSVLVKILGALHYAHDLKNFDGSPLNVVHRDVSPHNIFITYDGQPKLVDFGIAKAATSNAETATDVFKGKVTYSAPEQMQGKEFDRGVDVFSVGVMLFEALTGTRMWKGLSDRQVLARLINGEVPTSPRALNPDIPDELERICQKALAPERAHRYATAADFQTDLEQFLMRTSTFSSEREIGQYLANQFSEERQKLQTIIEKQLTALQSLPTDQYHIADIPPSREQGSNEPSSITTTGMAASALGTPSSWPPTASRKYKNIALALGITAIVTLGVVGYGIVSRNSTPQNTAAPTQSTKPSSLPTQANVIELSLSASPPNAQLFVDDVPLPSNPFSGKFPKDGASHRLRAEAPGFEKISQFVTFDKNDSIVITLRQAAAPVKSIEPPKHSGGPLRPPPRPIPSSNSPPSSEPTSKPTPITRPSFDNPWQ